MLPQHYHQDKFVALARDPSTLFVYWNIQADAVKEMARQMGDTVYAKSVWTIRLTNLSNAVSENVEIDLDARNWYIGVHPGCQYTVEIGLLRPDGVFFRALSAPTVSIPPLGYSHIYDKQWMILEEDYRKLLVGFTGWLDSSPGFTIKTPEPKPPAEQSPADDTAAESKKPTSPGAPSYRDRR